jgi:hypothetical protein
MPSFHPASAQFWKSLTWGSRLRLLLGVFLLFASAGLFLDLMQNDPARPWGVVVFWCVYSGLTAATYAGIGMARAQRWVPLVLALQFGIVALAPRALLMGEPALAASAAAIQQRARIDGIGALVLIVLGYAAMIRFIWGEGAQHVKLRTEVALAREIHDRIVPPVDVASHGVRVIGRAESSSAIGGDLVDSFVVGGRRIACVADVAGHGIAAGTLAGMMKSAVRMRLLAGGSLPDVLADLNRLVVGLERPGMFVTLALLVFDESGSAQWGLAGHPPILRFAAGQQTASRLPNPNLPLGVDPDATFASDSVAARAGDLFVLYTDGLIEVENRAGTPFEIEGIERVVAAEPERALEATGDAILAGARAHGPQDDDQTFCLVRVL